MVKRKVIFEGDVNGLWARDICITLSPQLDR